MAIRKRGKNWYIDYYVHGRRIREAVGPSRKVAERAVAKREVEVAENRFLDVNRKSEVTFDELARTYMDYARTNKVSWERDGHSLKHLSKAFHGRKLDQITPLMIEGYKSRRRRVAAPATVNRELACLKHMFTKAGHWGLASSNPVKGIRMFKESNTRLRYLSPDEIRRLYSELAEHIKPLVTLALFSGMRRGEILNLRWQDLDFHQGLIFITHSKNGDRREIPMAQEVAFQLERLPRTSEYVFTFHGGDRILDVRTGFERALRRAKIENFRFHDLRHTFASYLVMSGVDLLTVKELLGHKAMEMTLRYAHLSPDHKRKALASLEYFGSPKLVPSQIRQISAKS